MNYNFSEKLLEWYDRAKRDVPWRRFWHVSKDPYVVWVSEIMLQQTQISVVTPVYERFLKEFPNVRALAAATDEMVRQEVRGLGYYRRFRLLHQGAQTVVKNSPKTQIRWPRSAEEWLEVPGVGVYTAAALASITLNEAVAVVDGNVERVAARICELELAAGSPQLKQASRVFATERLDRKRPGDFNQALMELGQIYCVPIGPKCALCPVKSFCQAQKHGTQSAHPLPKPRPEFINVKMDIVIPVRKGAVGLVDRDHTARFLKNSRGFLIDPEDVEELKAIGVVKHSITKHKIVARVFIDTRKNDLAEFIDIDDVEPKLVANLDRKALHLLMKMKT